MNRSLMHLRRIQGILEEHTEQDLLQMSQRMPPLHLVGKGLLPQPRDGLGQLPLITIADVTQDDQGVNRRKM